MKQVKEKTKTQQEAQGPAERIQMMVARAPSFEDLVASFDTGPLDVPEPKDDDLEAHVRDIEQRLFDRSAEILEGALRFYEIDEPAEDVIDAPPKEWIDAYGEDAARKKFRLARYAQRSTRDSPVGTHYARDLFLGILNVRAKRDEAARPQSLNVALTQINISAPPSYPELVVVDKPKGRR